MLESIGFNFGLFFLLICHLTHFSIFLNPWGYQIIIMRLDFLSLNIKYVSLKFNTGDAKHIKQKKMCNGGDDHDFDTR